MTLTAPTAPHVAPSATVDPQVVLVAHGSPDPRHRDSVTAVANRMSRWTQVPVTACFLEHDVPAAEDVVPTGAGAVGSGITHRVVLPLLLTAGHHWHVDIPPVVGHLGHRATLLPPPQPVAFAGTVRELADGAAHVVLASAGSARPEVVQRFAHLAEYLSVDHEVAVALTPSAVALQARPGSVVVPVLVADGIFADRIRVAAHSAGATATAILGATPGFAHTLVAEVTAAL